MNLKEVIESEYFDENLKIGDKWYNLSCFEAGADGFFISVAEIPSSNKDADFHLSVLKGYYSKYSKNKEEIFSKVLIIFNEMSKCKDFKMAEKLFIENGLFKQ